jgi:hypothetical protein
MMRLLRHSAARSTFRRGLVFALAYAFAAFVFLSSLPVSAPENGSIFSLGCINNATGSENGQHSEHNDISCCVVHVHLSALGPTSTCEVTLKARDNSVSERLSLTALYHPSSAEGMNFQPRAPPLASV